MTTPPARRPPRRPWPRTGLAEHVRVHDPAEVTTSGSEPTVDPREVGLEQVDVDAIWQSVVDMYESGLQPGASLTLRVRGKLVLERAIGHTHGNGPRDAASTPKRGATPSSLFNLYSATKCITAMLVHLHDERGEISLDDPIAAYVPAFGKHGKDRITIRHMLSHRAGVASVRGSQVDMELLTDAERILDLLCDERPSHDPGVGVAYHALTSGFLLGAVLERVTGKPLRRILHDEIAAPLGLSQFSYGVASERVGDVAVNSFTGLVPFPPGSWMLERSVGVSVRDAVTLSNDRRFLTGVVPSGNLITTSGQAARFFDLLLHEGELDGQRVLAARTIRRAVAETTAGEVDRVLGLPVRYGMGFMLGGRLAGLYGADAEAAFGHIGFTAVVGWADPERRVAACLMTNGKPFLTLGQLAWLNVAWTIARRVPKVAPR